MLKRIGYGLVAVFVLIGLYTFVSVPIGWYREIQDYRTNVRPFVKMLQQRIAQQQAQPPGK